MKTNPIVQVLPDEYSTGIGRVTVQWSYLEHVFRALTYRLLDLDVKRGRVAVRDPRPKECVTMIRELIDLAGLKSQDKRLDVLPAALEQLQTERDMLAHGIWIKDPDVEGYLVRRTSGSWRPEANNQKVSRRIKPEGVRVSPEGLETLRKHIVDVTKVAQTVYDLVDAELTSRGKPPRIFEPHSPPPDPSGNTP